MQDVSGHCLGKELVMFVGYLEWEARKKERYGRTVLECRG